MLKGSKGDASWGKRKKKTKMQDPRSSQNIYAPPRILTITSFLRLFCWAVEHHRTQIADLLGTPLDQTASVITFLQS